MLKDFETMTFIGSKDLEKRREFYEDSLGLQYPGQDQYAITFQLKHKILRINHLPEFQARESTTMGWIVGEIEKTVRELNEKGVIMARTQSP